MNEERWYTVIEWTNQQAAGKFSVRPLDDFCDDLTAARMELALHRAIAVHVVIVERSGNVRINSSDARCYQRGDDWVINGCMTPKQVIATVYGAHREYTDRLSWEESESNRATAAAAAELI